MIFSPDLCELILADKQTLQKALARAAYVAEHLLQQVPEFTGVIGPEGQSEDDFIAAQIHDEIEGWKDLSRTAKRMPDRIVFGGVMYGRVVAAYCPPITASNPMIEQMIEDAEWRKEHPFKPLHQHGKENR
jgi:hypothetical protein